MSGTASALLYARVSTKGQADTGYSLRQQVEALRAWCESEGYEVLEEVTDPGYSGAYLERPGLDRVRDLVTSGGVSVVVAQDRDRFAREPAYLYLLKREFEEYGTKLRALNDHGDDSPEGELTDGILDQLAKFERAKIAERTRRGLKRKVNEGKVLRRAKPPYGFHHDEQGEALVPVEEELAVVRWIFRMIGAEGLTLGEVVRRLSAEGIPSPMGASWHRSTLRHLVLSELYRPLGVEEVAEQVSPEVARTLYREQSYGFVIYGRRRQTKQRERGPDGERRDRYTTVPRPREEWSMVPVDITGAGLSRELVDTARQRLSRNERRTPSSAAGRFWQLSGGIVQCAECGSVFSPQAHRRRSGAAGGWFYYRCASNARSAERTCHNTRSMRAEPLEEAVWEAVYGLVCHPERLLAQYREHIERKKRQMRGDPDKEVRELAERLEKLERRRSGYIDLAADGDMSREELRTKLGDLDEQRVELEKAYKEAQARQEALRQPQVNYAHLNSLLLQLNAQDLALASPEDRRRLYLALQLRASVDEERQVRISGIFDPDLYLSDLLKDPPDWLSPRPGTQGVVVTLDTIPPRVVSPPTSNGPPETTGRSRADR